MAYKHPDLLTDGDRGELQQRDWPRHGRERDEHGVVAPAAQRPRERQARGQEAAAYRRYLEDAHVRHTSEVVLCRMLIEDLNSCSEFSAFSNIF